MADSLAFVNGLGPSIYMLQVNSWVLHLLQNLVQAQTTEEISNYSKPGNHYI